MAQQLGSDVILKLLARRHSDAVFVPECKTGASNGGHLRMDAWVMAKSWANPRTWGYEVKVSRGDFLKDNKWQGYLPYCSEFYFVCPFGLIQPTEIPEPAGLLWATSTASMLVTKKKAAPRQVEIPNTLYRYVLMARSRIGSDCFNDDGYTQDKAAYWRQWLDDQKEEKELGYRVRQKVAERIAKMECEVIRVKKEMTTYDEIKAKLEAMGIDLRYGPPPTYSVERRLKEINDLIPEHLRYNLKHLLSELSQTVKNIDSFTDDLKKKADAVSLSPAA